MMINFYREKKIKISNKPHFTPQGARKPEQTKPKINRKNEMAQIRAEINRTETRKAIDKISKTKSWVFFL